jgi:PAS domain S-box-containing protein
VGMDTVAIPASTLKSMIAEESKQNVTTLFIGVMSLFLGIIFVLRFMISEHRVIEESLVKSESEKEAIIDGITDPMMYFQRPDMIAAWANDEAIKMAGKIAGVSKDEMMRLTCHQMYWGKENPCEHCPAIKTFQTGVKHAVELYAPDGSYHQIKSFPVKDKSGNLLGVIEMANDITAIKQAEARIAASEEKYRTILETIEEGYYEVDLGGNLVFFNDALCRILGYSRSELMGMNNRYFMSDETSRSIYRTFNQVFSTGEPSRGIDAAIIHKNGTKRYINISVTLMQDNNKKPISFRGVARDVTDYRQAEQALAASEEKFRILAETNIDTIIQINKNGNVIYASPSLVDFSGYTVEEFVGTHFLKYFPENQIPPAFEFFKKILSGETIKSQEFTAVQKDGNLINIEVSFSPLKQQQKIIGVQGTVRDITERSQFQKELKAREEKFRLLAEAIADSIFEISPEGIFTYVSPGTAAITGYSVEEIIGKPVAEFSPEWERPKAFESMKRVFSGEQIRSMELVSQKRNGELIYLEFTALPFIRDGKIVSIYGVARDITERKQVENALVESEERYRLIFQNAPIGITHYDNKGMVTGLNPKALEILKTTLEQAVGFNLLQKDQNEGVLNAISTAMSGKNGFYEGEFTSLLSGRDFFMRSYFNPILSDQSQIIGGICLMEDLTQEYEAMKSLAESEEKFRLLAESSNDGIFQMDLNGIFTYVSPAFAEIYQYAADEIVGIHYLQFIVEDKHMEVQELFNKLLVKEKIKSQDSIITRKDGRKIEINVSSAPIIKDGRVVAIQGVMRDITEQIQAQKELKESQKNLETLFDAITESVLLVDPEGVILALNQTAAHRLRSTQDQMIGKNAFDFLAEDVVQFRKAKLSEVARTRKPVSFEDIRYGRYVWTNFYPIFDDHGHVNRIAVFTMDIHGRKMAEDALRKSEEKYKLIFDSTPAALFFYNMDGVITDCNLHAPKMMGGSKEKIIGINMFERSDHQEILSCMRRSLKGEADRFEGTFTTGPDRRTVHIKAEYVPVYSQGKVLGGLCIGEDVTVEAKALQALWESEKKYRLIFDSSPLGIFHYDKNGVIQDCNLKTLELSGSSLEKLVGFNLLEGVTEELFLNAIRNSLAGISGELEGKYRSITGGKESYLRAFTVPIHSEDGTVKGGMCVAEDVSEKVLFEKALQESEKRYRVLFENAPVAIGVSDFEGNIKDFNSQLLELYGYSKVEAWSLRIRDAYNDAADREKCLNELNEYGKVVNKDVKFKRKNGDILDVLVSMNTIELEGQKYILGIYRDITEKKQAEVVLSQSHEKLRNLTKYLQSARENERTNIARELHDELGQALTAINMEAAWVAQKLPEGQDKIKPRAEAISDMAVGAIGVIKRIISELRPTLLTDLGLAAAIKWQAEEYQRRIGIRFEVNIDPEEIMVDEDLAIAIFRIFQEATTNAIRHAHATAVRVSLKENQNQIELAVKDNGIGITEDKINLNESYGILGMKERAQVFNGSLEVSGFHGKGTTIRARFPI